MYTDHVNSVLTLARSRGGGKFTPQRSFPGISPRPLETEGCGLVTFPEYGWATKRHQNRKSTYTRLSNMAVGNTGSDCENVVFSIAIIINQ